jgi:DNA-binding response OmpR family regulator
MIPALILLIDRCPDTRSMYGDYLRHHGYTVAEAPGGMAGVHMARMLRPDLIVTELADTPAWLQALRKGAAAAPEPLIVVCSSLVDPDRPVVPGGVDAELALPKPTAPSRLLHEVRQLLDGRASQPAANPGRFVDVDAYALAG